MKIVSESNTDLPSCFSQVIYCGGYSGGEPPLPIPNREVKPAIADGTAPPGGRVGSCRSSRTRPEILAGSFRFLPVGRKPQTVSCLRLLIADLPRPLPGRGESASGLRCRSAFSPCRFSPFLSFRPLPVCFGRSLSRRTTLTFDRRWKVVHETWKNGFILLLPVEGCGIFLFSRIPSMTEGMREAGV